MHSKVDKKVVSYYDDPETHAFYTKLWGEGNIHFGFFPELSDDASQKSTETSYERASELLTLRMGAMASLTADSRVLDLGSGYGKPLIDLITTHECEGVGVDLSQPHIDFAHKLAARSGLVSGKGEQIDFVHGSFLDLSQFERGSFTHVFTQAALCHGHDSLDVAIQQARDVLVDGGVFVINDMVSDERADERTQKYVYDRMSFRYLVSTDVYLSTLRKNGFEIVQFENLDEHFFKSYAILSERADENGKKELSKKYDETCSSIRRGQYGMINIVARKKAKCSSSDKTHSKL